MLRLILLSSFAVGFVAPATAINYSVVPKLGVAFDYSFTPIEDYDLSSGQPALLAIDFIVVADESLPTPFVSTVFDIDLTGALDDSTFPGFTKTPYPFVGCPGGLVCLIDPIPSNPLHFIRTWNMGPVGSIMLDYGGGQATISTSIRGIFLYGPLAPVVLDPLATYSPQILLIGVPEPTTLTFVATLGAISAVRRRA